MNKFKPDYSQHKIVWLTGQSGVGKSTLAYSLKNRKNYLVLDGDEMRECISSDLGLSKEDRRENNLRIAGLAKILSQQTNVVVSVIAPEQSVRDEITKICNPCWVYLKRNLPEREGHFYEEPTKYPMIEIGKNNTKENKSQLNNIIYENYYGK